MTRLSASARARLKSSSYAIPRRAKTAKAKKEHGNYPIPDKLHARFALAMVAKHGTPAEKATVRKAIERKYPGIIQKKAGGGDVTGLITELYGLVSEVGTSVKENDYGRLNEYGGLDQGGKKGENKYVIGDMMSSQLDPLAWSLDEIENGNTAAGIINLLLPGVGSAMTSKSDVKEFQKTENKNKYAEMSGKADVINYRNKIAQGAAADRKIGMLSEGGVVTGEDGTDTNLAAASAGDFVIPKKAVKGEVRNIAKRLGLYTPMNKNSDGSVPVLLTAGEIVVPKQKQALFDKMLRKKGINGLQSLAPNAEPENRMSAGGEVEDEKGKSKVYKPGESEKSEGALVKTEEMIRHENEENVKRIHRIQRETGARNPNMKNHRRSNGSMLQEKILDESCKAANKAANAGKYSKGGEIQARIDVLRKIQGSRPLTDAESNELKNLEVELTNQKESGSGDNTLKTVTGLVQGLSGAILSAGMGKAPILDEKAILGPKFDAAGFDEALRRSKQDEQFGMDPQNLSFMKDEINKMFVGNLTNAKMYSGSPNTAFNNMTASGLMRFDQMLKLSSQDAEMRNAKRETTNRTMMASDQFRYGVARDRQNDVFRLKLAEQQFYEKEAEGFGNLMQTGIANMFDTSDMATFMREYGKVSNPYIG